MSYVTAPQVEQTGNTVLLATDEMRAAADRFGSLADELTGIGNNLSTSIQQGLGPTSVWSSPKNKPHFIEQCTQLFAAFNTLVGTLYESQTELNSYINDREEHV